MAIYILFKADDLSTISKAVISLDKFVNKFDIKVCWGIIGKYLNNHKTVDFIKSKLNTCNYEFFNHGYDHNTDSKNNIFEFKGKNIDYQLEHFYRTQDLFYKKTGGILHGFGAPCNAIDQNTTVAISKYNEKVENSFKIKYWFNAHMVENGHMIENVTNIKTSFILESKVGVITFKDLLRFRKNFSKQVKNDKLSSDKTTLITIQIHPYFWTFLSFVYFRIIITYLCLFNKSKFKFVTPSEAIYLPNPQLIGIK